MRNLGFTIAIVATGLAVIGFSGGNAKAIADGNESLARAPARTVSITANDALQFSLSEIRASPGEILRVVLKNVGSMPKQAMAHNWVLLEPMTGSEINAFGLEASSNPPSYLPKNSEAVIAHTEILGAGEEDEVIFAAPTTPGEYPFLCTFPGHFAVMRGMLVVK